MLISLSGLLPNLSFNTRSHPSVRKLHAQRIVVRWEAKVERRSEFVAWREKSNGCGALYRVSSKNAASSECRNRLFYVLCMVSGSVCTGFLV